MHSFLILLISFYTFNTHTTNTEAFRLTSFLTKPHHNTHHDNHNCNHNCNYKHQSKLNSHSHSHPHSCSPLNQKPKPALVIGLNKYSHDTSLTSYIINNDEDDEDNEDDSERERDRKNGDTTDNRLILSVALERLTRLKHAGDSVNELVRRLYRELKHDDERNKLSPSSSKIMNFLRNNYELKVVSNNHLFNTPAFENPLHKYNVNGRDALVFSEGVTGINVYNENDGVSYDGDGGGGVNKMNDDVDNNDDSDNDDNADDVDLEVDNSVTSTLNLFNNLNAKHISHHLAHFYSSLPYSSCSHNTSNDNENSDAGNDGDGDDEDTIEGISIVMDGMGQDFRDFYDASIICDIDVKGKGERIEDDTIIQPSIEYMQTSSASFREAETCYSYSLHKKTGVVKYKVIFKRFSEIPSCVTTITPGCNNYGFENMNSLGAMYSRVSSCVFGDWNKCGSVMGLSSYYNRNNDDEGDGGIVSGEIFDNSLRLDYSRDGVSGLLSGKPLFAKMKIRKGGDREDKDIWKGLDPTMSLNVIDNTNTDVDVEGGSLNENENGLRNDMIKLCGEMQGALEVKTINLIKSLLNLRNTNTNTDFKRITQINTSGGVFLNSLLNKRIIDTFGNNNGEGYSVGVTPFVGDEGVSEGCARFCIHDNAHGILTNSKLKVKIGNANNKVRGRNWWAKPTSFSTGPAITKSSILKALNTHSSKLSITHYSSCVALLAEVTLRLASTNNHGNSNIIAWYNGRSEVGARALGHRSILTNAFDTTVVGRINSVIKSRESFRPFACSISEDECQKWFDVNQRSDSKDSVAGRYMTSTYNLREGKDRGKCKAILHVDGTSRIQIVSEAESPVYHALLKQYYETMLGKNKEQGKHDGEIFPGLLNTSFNTIPGEPIVETPEDAIRSFLYTHSNDNDKASGLQLGQTQKQGLDHLIFYHGTTPENGEGWIVTLKPPETLNVNANVMTDDTLILPSERIKEGLVSSMDESWRCNYSESEIKIVRIKIGEAKEWIELYDRLELEILGLIVSGEEGISVSEIVVELDESEDVEGVLERVKRLEGLGLVLLRDDE